MRACYRMHTRAAGFDFFLWLVLQKALGATRIEIDRRNPKIDKWPRHIVERRIDSIIMPGPALAGLPCTEGEWGKELSHGDQFDVVQRCLGGLKLPPLATVLPPGKARYTVTLRTTQRNPGRNSDEQVWRDFAAEIGAQVIEDYDVKPIHLHERMALYAGAEQNFFVTNGPSILCLLSEYPAMCFDCQHGSLVHLGLPYGAPYPFMRPQHQQIYEPPTPEALRWHFEAWLNRKERVES